MAALALVQLSTPGSHAIHTLQVDTSTASIGDLVLQVLQESGDELVAQACAKPQDGNEKNPERWAIRRKQQARGDLDYNGLLPRHLTVAAALSNNSAPTATELPSSASPQRPPNKTQFSSFALTGHLHKPQFELVYLPNQLNVHLRHVPGFEDDAARRTMYLGEGSTAGQVVEAVIEELGIKKVMVVNSKTVRMEYALQVEADVASPPKTLPFPTKLLPHLSRSGQLLPFQVVFTISPAWLSRAPAAVVQAVAAQSFSEVTSSSAPPPPSEAPSSAPQRESGSNASSPPAQDDTRVGVPVAWRPASLFGGLWGAGVEPTTSPPAETSISQLDEAAAERESDSQDETTIKGTQSQPQPTSAASRLSTLFTEWIAPEGSKEPLSAPRERRTRLVSEPLAITEPREMSIRFSRTFTSDGLSSAAVSDDGEIEVSADEGLDVRTALEHLIEDLGMKPAQREVMRQLPTERQQWLISQYSETSKPSPLQSSRTGPEPDSGALAGLKRLSLWATSSPSSEPPSKSPAARRPVTTYDSGLRNVHDEVESARPPVPNTSVIAPQNTASWSSWWGAVSNPTGANGLTAKDTPQFYVDQLKSSKISQRSLIKHLIALRVRLSTSKVSWAIDFLDVAKGLNAIENLLERATSRAMRESEGRADEDEGVQTECVRCLRILMNTEIGFERVLTRPTLVTFVVYSLHTASNKLRTQVADVLAALCVLSLHEGHRLVLAAMADFRIAFGERYRFEYLMQSISLRDMQAMEDGELEFDDEPGLWEYRAAAMTLLNAIVNSPEDLEQRMALRDELSRRGLNETLTGLRYADPPESFLTQLAVYNEERQEDQEELHERTVGRSRADSSDMPLGELLRLANEHEDLYPVLVATVKKFVAVFDRPDVDDHLRSDLVTVLDQFLSHIVHLEDFDTGWRHFMRTYLASVQHIVGQQTLVRSFRAGDKENFSGVIQRLVQREKEVLQLQNELAKLTRAQKLAPYEMDMKKDRSENTRKWDTLKEEVARSKSQIADLELQVQARDKEILYLKRAMESVYSRFQSATANATLRDATEPLADTRAGAVVDPRTMATRTIEALNKRDEEIATLKEKLEMAQAEAAARLRLPKAFARQAPLAPSGSLASKATVQVGGDPPNRKTNPVTVANPAPLAISSPPASPGVPLAPPPPPPSPPPSMPAVSGAQSGPGSPPRAPAPPRTLFSPARTTKKLKPFFWNKITSDISESTFWSEADVVPLEVLDLELEFAVGSKMTSRTVPTSSSTGSKKTSTLLSLNRAQNIAIMLARFRMPDSHAYIKAHILSIDDEKLSVEQLRSLKQLIPSSDETVLALGNALNGGTFRGNATGFQLDSLHKLKETRAVNPSGSTPTLLHFLVRSALRSDPSLLSFIDEAPHVEAASRVSFAGTLASVQTLVSGVAGVKYEIGEVKRNTPALPGDNFIPAMTSFIKNAEPAIDALKTLAAKLDADLRHLLEYYGEDPSSSKPEDLFGTVSAFSSSLLRARDEVLAADARLPLTASQKDLKIAVQPDTPARRPREPSTLLQASPSWSVSDGGSIGRGGLDGAIRDLRSGHGTHRQRSQSNHRPLSRVFYDGT